MNAPSFCAALLALLTAGPVALAQPTWLQTAGPIGSTITTIQVLSSGTILAAAPAAVFRSLDRGVTWSAAGFPPVDVTAFERDSANNAYAATPSGIYRSSDDGKTWAQFAFTDLPVSAIAATRSHLFAIANEGPPYDPQPATFRSSNAGATWQRIDSLLLPNNREQPMRISARDSVVVAGGGTDLFRSEDNGDSWRLILTLDIPVPSSCEDTYPRMGVLAVLDSGRTLVASSSVTSVARLGNGSILVGADMRMRRSTDNGNHWDSIPGSPRRIHQIVERSGDVVYARSLGSLFRSDDGGTTWTALAPSLRIADITRIIGLPGGRLYSEVGGESLVSTDRGDTWSPSGFPTGVLSRASDGVLTILQTLYAGGLWEYRIYNSSDGVQWTEDRLPDVRLSISRFFAMRNGTLFVKTPGSDYGCVGYWQGSLHRSTDKGRTWASAFEGAIGTQAMVQSESGVIYMGLALQAPSNNISAIGPKAGVLASRDNGSSWKRIDSASGIEYVVTMIALGGDTLIVATQSGIRRTDDGGRTWRRADAGIGDRNITDLVQTLQGKLFASTSSAGVFTSSDGGDSWRSFNDELAYRRVNTLALDSAGMLYAGTRGASIFRTVGSTIGVRSERALAGATTLSIYPTPLIERGTITLNLDRVANVRVSIVDETGAEVVIVHNARLHAGDHGWQLAGDLLPRGAYIVVASVDGEQVTRKFVRR